MALTPVIQFGLHTILGESVPALVAQCEFCQTDEGLEKHDKKWRETVRERREITWGTLYSPARAK
jgi:hypothetical protein